MIAGFIFLGFSLLALLWVVAAYNRLVSFRNRFRNAFAQIDVQPKRRYDLIPNLVETAKAYLKHEHETLVAVIAARHQAVTANARAALDPTDAGALHQMAAAEGAMTVCCWRWRWRTYCARSALRWKRRCRRPSGQPMWIANWCTDSA